MLFTSDGVILKSIDSGEHDKLLTILTPKEGRITVLSKGAKSMKSPLMALSQQFIYGNFELYQKGNLYWLKSGAVSESFFSLRNDLEKLSLSSYLTDVVSYVTDEGIEAVNILRLFLNSLYAISNEKYSLDIIKGAFEFRIAALCGYMPCIDECYDCHATSSESFLLDVMNGRVLCSECMRKRERELDISHLNILDESHNERNIIIPLTNSALTAVRYVLQSPVQRIFAFNITDKNDMSLFSRAAEVYLTNHLETSFETLKFYKSLNSY